MERVRIKDIAKMADVSVGTVDRVIHGRRCVRVQPEAGGRILLKQLDYQPNMYASALAGNKKYAFACLLPMLEKGEYWTDVETGIHNAVETYSVSTWPCTSPTMTRYDYHSFAEASDRFWHWSGRSDVCPHRSAIHQTFTDELTQHNIPYIYIDSKEEPPSFYGQNSHQKGIFCRPHADVVLPEKTRRKSSSSIR